MERLQDKIDNNNQLKNIEEENKTLKLLDYINTINKLIHNISDPNTERRLDKIRNDLFIILNDKLIFFDEGNKIKITERSFNKMKLKINKKIINYFTETKGTIFTKGEINLSSLLMTHYIPFYSENNQVILAAIMVNYILKFFTNTDELDDNFKELSAKLKKIIKLIESSPFASTSIKDELIKTLKDIRNAEDLEEILVILKEDISNLILTTKIMMLTKLYERLEGMSKEKKELDKNLFYLLLFLLDNNNYHRLTFQLIPTFLELTVNSLELFKGYIFINPILDNIIVKENIHHYLEEDNENNPVLCLYIEDMNEIKIFLTYDEAENLNCFLNIKNEENEVDPVKEINDFENKIIEEILGVTSANLVDYAMVVVNNMKRIEDKIVQMYVESAPDKEEEYKSEIRQFLKENMNEKFFLENAEDKKSFIQNLEKLFSRVIQSVGNGISGMNLDKDIKREERGLLFITKKKNVFINCCYKDIKKDKSNSVVLTQCGHNFCRGCLKKYIKFNTHNNVFLGYFDKETNIRTLKCMKKDCKFFITTEDIENIYNDKNLLKVIEDNFKKRFIENLKKLNKNFFDEKINKYPCIICSKVVNDMEIIYDCQIKHILFGKEYFDYHVICDQCLDEISLNSLEHQKNNKEKFCPALGCRENMTEVISKRIGKKRKQIIKEEENNNLISKFFSDYKMAIREIEERNCQTYNTKREKEIKNPKIFPRNYIFNNRNVYS